MSISTKVALFAGAAPAVTALTLAGCSTAPGTTTHLETPAAHTASPAKPSLRPSAKPSPTALSMTQIDAMVRTLYYGESQAYQDSPRDGFAYVLAHDYPGSVDRQKFLACAAKFEAQNPGAIYLTVPEIDTLAPDPAWVGPKGIEDADWTFAGKKPKGQTFILTVDVSVTSPSAAPSTAKSQVHVTIWNGTAYYFESACSN